MAEPENIEEAIESVAIGTVSVSKENGREVQHTPIQDLIAADQYLASKRAKSKPHFGLRMTKCVPPGGG